MATRPRVTGRAPLSPPRTRANQILTYSPSESAMTSGAADAAVWAAIASASSAVASDGGSWTSVLTRPPLVTAGSRLGSLRGEAFRGTCGHEVDDGLAVELRLRPGGDQVAEPQHRHPVRDGKDVVQVVRDEDHPDALAGQPGDEL